MHNKLEFSILTETDNKYDVKIPFSDKKSVQEIFEEITQHQDEFIPTKDLQVHELRSIVEGLQIESVRFVLEGSDNDKNGYKFECSVT